MPDDNNLPTSTDPNRPVLTTEEVPTINPPVQDPAQPASPTTPTDTPISVPETTDVPPLPPSTETTETPPLTIPTEGSSAPSFDLPPVVGATPKKKFGGKKVISTILGLLLLIGGVGVGVTLVRQQQDIREKAAGGCESYDNALTCSGQCVNGKKCVWSNGSKTCGKSETSCLGGTTTTTKSTSKTTTGSPTCYENCISAGNTPSECSGLAKCTTSTTSSTSSGGNYICEGSCEPSQTTCKGKGGTPTGNNGNLADNGDCGAGQICCVGGEAKQTAKTTTTTTTTTTSTGGTSSSGTCSAILSAAKCQGGEPGNSCSGIDGTCKDTGQKDQNGKAICSCKITSSTCKEECPSTDGILRNCTPPEADGTPEESICSKAGRIEACGGKSYCCPAAGGKWTTNMSACEGSGQCNNIKAYDTNFNPLTADQLKALKAGDKVRFAVKGSSTNTKGTFDKAKFKINGEDKGEVTQQKPESTEFYYEYTIPEGITSFNITAQIHHTVLDWSN